MLQEDLCDQFAAGTGLDEDRLEVVLNRVRREEHRPLAGPHSVIVAEAA